LPLKNFINTDNGKLPEKPILKMVMKSRFEMGIMSPLRKGFLNKEKMSL